MENIFTIISKSSRTVSEPILHVLDGEYTSSVNIKMVVTRTLGNDRVEEETFELESCSGWNSSCSMEDLVRLEFNNLERKK